MSSFFESSEETGGVDGLRFYTIDSGLFKTWSRRSSWLYGWILTDGSINKDSGQIKIMLKSHDIDGLYKFKTLLKFSGKVYSGRQTDGREYSYLRVCRKEMVGDLIDLGMAHENKTFNTSLPDVPDEYFWDFMRGVFEGDGNLKHGKQWNDLQITLSGATKSFFEDVRIELEARGVRTTLKEHPPGRSGRKAPLYTLTTKSNADALRWCLFMYEGTPEALRLDRKFKIFTNYVEGYYDRNRRSKACIELIECIRRTIPECAEPTASTPELTAA